MYYDPRLGTDGGNCAAITLDTYLDDDNAVLGLTRVLSKIYIQAEQITKPLYMWIKRKQKQSCRFFPVDLARELAKPSRARSNPPLAHGTLSSIILSLWYSRLSCASATQASFRPSCRSVLVLLTFLQLVSPSIKESMRLRSRFPTSDA